MKITKVKEICYSKAREFGFNLYCEVKENGRLTRTLGRVCYDSYGELDRIEFSKLMLETASDAVVLDVILHELAHAFVYLETEEYHGHDATFKAMCHRLGTDNDGSVYKEAVIKPKQFKYSIVCSECGRIIGGRSRACNVTKFPEDYLSPCCDANIHIIQNF